MRNSDQNDKKYEGIYRWLWRKRKLEQGQIKLMNKIENDSL